MTNFCVAILNLFTTVIRVLSLTEDIVAGQR